MNKTLILITILAAGATLSGCGNTLNGAKQDAATDTAKTQAAADQATAATKAEAQKAGQAVANVPQDAAANALRIPVKAAIDRDPVLTQSGNLIDANGSGHTITLTGHVTKADMKQRATEDAQVALQKHPGYTLVNELTLVGGAGQ